ncbi:hypothetical protein V6N13_089643 [Hibiscus sabdariffa]|uniref:Uncharacterized protein n=1 Tax=Hibiscus sabdariffa TaxID=183260 RepID=A0ABR2QJH7_9ROSI
MEPEDPPVNMPRGSAVDPDEEDNNVTPSDSSDAKRPKLALLFRCYVLSSSSRVEPHRGLQQRDEIYRHRGSSDSITSSLLIR